MPVATRTGLLFVVVLVHPLENISDPEFRVFVQEFVYSPDHIIGREISSL
nr:MAG TPA: hypothetical protein [Caudoviricetes sp.]DAY21402.1 MAG TPA: hypothetical protein [Caudoviricetes sp.]